MLYISRQINELSYGVVDTDKDVEKEVTVKQLKNMLFKRELEIAGVTVDQDTKKISNIVPYQDPQYCSALQAKMLTLNGIEVRTYKEYVTGITLHSDLANGESCVRLSDFGSKAAYMFPIGGTIGTRRELIIVLDDNIEIDKVKVKQTGVRWDLRDVHRGLILDAVYEELTKNALWANTDWTNYLIDHEGRMNAFKEQGDRQR